MTVRPAVETDATSDASRVYAEDKGSGEAYVRVVVADDADLTPVAACGGCKARSGASIEALTFLAQSVCGTRTRRLTSHAPDGARP